jgi:hypothetical protein
MLRDLVKKAFDETLPGMGFKTRVAQFQYAMMVADKLEAGAATNVEWRQSAVENAEGVDPSGHPGVRPTFAAIEAGTGTGKTWGYLIPTLLLIAQSGGKARITTHNLALQDQIYGRHAIYSNTQPDYRSGDRSDMAIALEVVERITTKRLTAGFRKGRQAYVSPEAVFDLLDIEKAEWSARHGDDATLANDLRKWALEVMELQNRMNTLAESLNKTGDDADSAMERDRLKAEQAELMVVIEKDGMQGLIASFMDAHEGRLPKGISAAQIGMVSGVNDNPFHQHHGGHSMNQDVLVVSHTLSLIDLQLGGNRLLPTARVVVHDEADTLGNVGEMYARTKISPITLLHGLEKAYPDPASRAEPVTALHGLLLEIMHWFSQEYDRRNPTGEDGEPVLVDPVQEVMLDDKESVTISSLQYLKKLSEVLSVVSSLSVQDGVSLRVRRFHSLVSNACKDLKIAETAFPANTLSGMRQMKLELDETGLPADWKTRKYNAHLALGLTWSPVKKLAAFEVVNLYAGRLFSKEWFFKSDTLETVLLTSATLRNPPAANGKMGEWDYMRSVLGMPTDGQVVSVKKFGDIARIHLMRDVKNEKGVSMLKTFLPRDRHGVIPYNPEWVAGAQSMLVDMLKTGERGLVLAISFRDVQVLMEGFLDDRIWWQTDAKSMHWKDGVKSMQDGRCQIMVTPSVWSGANIRARNGGQLFRHLGVLRCPRPPVDMVHQKALANYFMWKGLKDGGDPFVTAENCMRSNARYAGKHKMTQGLGRGIRAAGDVIEVWLMHPELGHQEWQATFPERFRGLFADPDALHVVDVQSAGTCEKDEAIRKQNILDLIKRPLPPKAAGNRKSNKGDRHV